MIVAAFAVVLFMAVATVTVATITAITAIAATTVADRNQDAGGERQRCRDENDELVHGDGTPMDVPTR